MRKFLLAPLFVGLILATSVMTQNVEASVFSSQCGGSKAAIKHPETDNGRTLVGCIEGPVFNSSTVKTTLKNFMYYRTDHAATTQNAWFKTLPVKLQDQLYDVLSYWWAWQRNLTKTAEIDTKVSQTTHEDLRKHIKLLKSEFSIYWQDSKAYHKKHAATATKKGAKISGEVDLDSLTDDELEYFILEFIKAHDKEMARLRPTNAKPEDYESLFAAAEKEEIKFIAHKERKTVAEVQAELKEQKGIYKAYTEKRGNGHIHYIGIIAEVSGNKALVYVLYRKKGSPRHAMVWITQKKTWGHDAVKSLVAISEVEKQATTFKGGKQPLEVQDFSPAWKIVKIPG